MKKVLIIIIIFISLIGGVFIFSSGKDLKESSQVVTQVNNKEPEKTNEHSQFDRAPGFLLSNFDGGTVSLTDSVGKIRVVNSWATWCPFCVEELADFVRLQEEFSDRVVVVTINRSESLSKARSFADELGITDGMTMLLDPKDSFYKSIGGFSMPETLFIDGDGNIRVHKRGPMRFEEMKEKVESIINSS